MNHTEKSKDLNKLCLIRYLTASIFLSLFTFSVSFGSEVDSAKRARDNAYVDYYKTLRSSHNYSPENIKQLRSNILQPAENQLYKAQQAEFDRKHPPRPAAQAIDRSNDPNFKVERRRKIAAALKWVKEAKYGAKGSKKDGKSSGAIRPSHIENDSGPSRPEVILDGKGIPRELEFKGKSK